MIARRIKQWSTVSLAVLGIAGTASGQVNDKANYLFLLAENFEQAPELPGRPVRFEGNAWYGGGFNRLWMKLDGDAATEESDGEVEVHILFSRMIAPYWDLQIGMRMDASWGDQKRSRNHLAIGLQGLAPYWFEVETTLFISTAGDVSVSFQANYDLLFTQRLILEPDIEVNASLRNQPEWGLASGFTDAQFGLRLRYEIRREFAPYVGYLWQSSYGGTADLVRTSGGQLHQGSLVVGLRLWY